MLFWRATLWKNKRIASKVQQPLILDIGKKKKPPANKFLVIISRNAAAFKYPNKAQKEKPLMGRSLSGEKD